MKHNTVSESVPAQHRATANGQNPRQQVTPFCFRLPKPRTIDPYFGGSRTFWNQQVLPCEANGFKPTVRSVVKKQPGARRGVRFILYSSAVEFFEKLAAEQSFDAQVGSDSFTE